LGCQLCEHRCVFVGCDFFLNRLFTVQLTAHGAHTRAATARVAHFEQHYRMCFSQSAGIEWLHRFRGEQLRASA
jgi:hypothetical protein